MTPVTEDTDPKAALYALWGDLNPDEYGSVHFHVSINPDIGMARRQIVMGVQFDQEVRVIGGYRHVLEGKKAVGADYLEDLELMGRRPRFVYIEKLKGILKEIGPTLYEWDPRLGHFLKDFNDHLPRCPLFDPPLIPNPEWEVRDWTMNVPNETPCPICGEKFTAHNKPMWGGGNVCWVHAECWGKGLHPEMLRVPINLGLGYLTVT